MSGSGQPVDGEAERFDLFLTEWSRREFLRRMGGAAAFLAFASGALPIAACTTATAPQSGTQAGATRTGGPAKGGTVTEGNQLPVIEFNPVNRTNTPHNINVPLVWECLYAVDAGGTIQPRLAAALPAISSDALTYTVPLRKNVVWSDGQPLNADDVLFMWTLMLDPQYATVVSAHRNDMRNKVANFAASDPYTVVFKLKAPDAPFLSRLCNINIAAKHTLSSLTAAQIQQSFTEPPTVVNGVFKVNDWKRGEYVKYVRNDSYYDGAAYLDAYLYKVIPTTEGLMNQLKTGEIDAARIPSPGVFDQLKEIPNVGVLFIPATFVHGHAYNLDPERPSYKIFGSKAVRQALRYAVDRDGMIAGIFFGYAKAQDSVLIPQSWAYAEPKIRYTYDLKKANDMLEADGWKMGSSGIREKNGMPLKFEFLTSTGTPETALMAQATQRTWKQVGAEVTVLPLGQPEWIAKTNVDHDFDVGYGGASPSPLDPDLAGSLHSRNAGSKGSNYTSYKNEEVDKLLEQALATPDQASRKALYTQIQDIVNDESPVSPALVQQYAWAYNKRVHGLGEGEVGVYNIITQRITMNKVFVTG